ncbi:hypothetical protein ACWEF6_08310 [Amycolatopsis sp. NPDC004772]
MLTAMAQHGYGFGIFVLAVGIAAVVARKVTHFDERIHAPQPLLGIVMVALVGIGAVAVSFADGGEALIVRLPFFAIASLVADIFVDFGSGWDDLVNLSTASFAAASVAVVTILLYDSLPEYGRLTDHYAYLLMLAAGFGASAAVVLITTVATFDLAGFVELLLTAAAVAGAYLIVPLLGFFLLHAFADDDASSDVVGEAIDEVIDNVENRLAVVGSLVAGFFVVAALVALMFGKPPGWLVGVLVLGAIAAAFAAARWGRWALTDLVLAISAGALPGRIAGVLDGLRQSDPVFRLLPGAESPLSR